MGSVAEATARHRALRESLSDGRVLAEYARAIRIWHGYAAARRRKARESMAQPEAHDFESLPKVGPGQQSFVVDESWRLDGALNTWLGNDWSSATGWATYRSDHPSLADDEADDALLYGVYESLQRQQSDRRDWPATRSELSAVTDLTPPTTPGPPVGSPSASFAAPRVPPRGLPPNYAEDFEEVMQELEAAVAVYLRQRRGLGRWRLVAPDAGSGRRLILVSAAHRRRRQLAHGWQAWAARALRRPRWLLMGGARDARIKRLLRGWQRVRHVAQLVGARWARAACADERWQSREMVRSQPPRPAPD